MNDPLIARFAEACGATHPLNLRVGLAEGGVLAEGSVQQPFTLIGRSDACDVTLNDPEVNPRHAWFQVVGGHIYALDLGSRSGLVWPDGSRQSGWLQPNSPVRVGPFDLQVCAPVSDRTNPPILDPMVADPAASKNFPAVQLDFRNGKRLKDRWTVNRSLTLVGRSDICKLHLQADDISSFHCGLVLTATGLWVVDLSGRGVVVNGERMRVSPLSHGAELWVGRFLIGCHYPALGETPGAGRSAHGNTMIASNSGAPTRRIPTPPPIAEDEVPLGGMPVHDATSGLPSSHILCDAFSVPASSGPISAPIFVTGANSGSNPANAQVPAPTQSRKKPSTLPAATLVLPTDGSVAPLLRQLSELHGQMLDQFQQSLQLMAKLFSRVPSADSQILQQELARIQDVNAELAKLQGEVTRHSVALLSEGPTSKDPTPLPDAAPLEPRTKAQLPAEAIQEWVEARIGVLQNERRSRWEKLCSLVGGAAE